jgi:hypothetical protein
VGGHENIFNNSPPYFETIENKLYYDKCKLVGSGTVSLARFVPHVFDVYFPTMLPF